MSIKYYPYKKEEKPNLRPLYFRYFNEVCEPALYKFMETRPTGQEANEHNVSIEIKIDGIEVDPEEFFNHYFEMFKIEVRVEATKLSEAQTKGVSRKMADAMREFDTKLVAIRNEVYSSIEKTFDVYE